MAKRTLRYHERRDGASLGRSRSRAQCAISRTTFKPRFSRRVTSSPEEPPAGVAARHADAGEKNDESAVVARMPGSGRYPMVAHRVSPWSRSRAQTARTTARVASTEWPGRCLLRRTCQKVMAANSISSSGRDSRAAFGGADSEPARCLRCLPRNRPDRMRGRTCIADRSGHAFGAGNDQRQNPLCVADPSGVRRLGSCHASRGRPGAPAERFPVLPRPRTLEPPARRSCRHAEDVSQNARARSSFPSVAPHRPLPPRARLPWPSRRAVPSSVVRPFRGTPSFALCSSSAYAPTTARLSGESLDLEKPPRWPLARGRTRAVRVAQDDALVAHGQRSASWADSSSSASAISRVGAP